MNKYVLNQRGASSDENLARQAFKEGMILYGYCCGFFGRDSYGDKVITQINSNVIVVEENGCTNVCDTTKEHFSWVDLLNSSNSYLEQEEEV